MKENTIGKILLKRVQLSAHNNAIGWIEAGEVKSLSFQNYKISIEQLSLGLIKEGLQVGDKVAILSQTCKEWNLCDMAVMCARGIVVPIYPSYLAHEIAYIIEHSDTTILIVENDSQMEKVLTQIEKLPNLKLIISIAPLSEEIEKKFRNQIKYIALRDLVATGANEFRSHPDLFEENIKQQKPEEIASIIYTSGTTGEPKGAVITHHGMSTMLRNVESFIKGAFNSSDRSLVFLPLSHVLGRCDSLLPLIFGWQSVYAESLEK
jgi:long-chain acyl-CoA synthetase